MVTLLGIIFLKPIVRALGASNQVYIYTYQYAFIMILGAVVVIGNFAYSQLLRAEGSAIKSMIGMVIGTVLNLILDPLFIFTFDLGVTGAAIATIIGNLERVKEIIKKGSWLTTTIGSVLLVLFTLCSSFLISIFIKDEEVIRIGTIIL